MLEQIILNVSYSEKDVVKKLGAKWNKIIKRWCVEKDHKNLELLAKWSPPENSLNANLKIYPSYYLIEALESCWKCNYINDVICLGADSVTDSDSGMPEKILNNFVILQYIKYLPDVFISQLNNKSIYYFKDYSYTTKEWYFMNHCKECLSKFGDYDLNHPGGAFCPIDEVGIDNIKSCLKLDVDEVIEIEASYGVNEFNLKELKNMC